MGHRQAKHNFILTRADGTERYFMRGQIIRDTEKWGAHNRALERFEKDVEHPYVLDHSHEWSDDVEIQPIVDPKQAAASKAELRRRAEASEAVNARPKPSIAASEKEVAKPVK